MAPEPSREQVAEQCGIELARAPVDRVPVQPVRETGTVTCAMCGREPDPPFRPVARFDDGTIRCVECEAEHRPYPDDEGLALALADCGWTADDMEQFGSPLGHKDGAKLLKSARRR